IRGAVARHARAGSLGRADLPRRLSGDLLSLWPRPLPGVALPVVAHALARHQGWQQRSRLRLRPHLYVEELCRLDPVWPAGTVVDDPAVERPLEQAQLRTFPFEAKAESTGLIARFLLFYLTPFALFIGMAVIAFFGA